MRIPFIIDVFAETEELLVVYDDIFFQDFMRNLIMYSRNILNLILSNCQNI